MGRLRATDCIWPKSEVAVEVAAEGLALVPGCRLGLMVTVRWWGLYWGLSNAKNLKG